MQREIKFRAWDELRQRWLNGICLDLQCGRLYSCVGVGDFVPEDWDKVTLMQYTGLHDCNGKEIYEGDILSDKSFAGRDVYWLVEWSRDKGDACFGLAGFGDQSVDKEGYLWLGCAEQMEVIGNRYQNP